MPAQSSIKNTDFQNVYIGLDVHLKQWNVSIIQGGIRRKSFQQTPSVTALLSHLKTHYPGYRYYSAYEAGVCGYSIHYSLEKVGIHNIVINGADVSKSSKDRVRKTDSLDAARIATELSRGNLRCIYIPTEKQIEDRSLLRARQMLVADIKRWKCRIRHYLHVNGIEIPAAYRNGKWPVAFFDWLLEVCVASLSTPASESLKEMVASLTSCLERCSSIEKMILRLMREDRYKKNYELLQSVPGVGKVTAFSILLECGDLSAFSSADKFCAFLGLIPDTNQSDQHVAKCNMTQRRHKTLRYMLTECVNRAIRDYPEIGKTYARYCYRMHRNKAKVKIAHKLAKCIKFVIKHQSTYDPFKWT